MLLIGFTEPMAEKQEELSVWLFHGITVVGVIWYFNLQGQSSGMLYFVCTILGLGTGFWAMFVTMAAEQFGTNIRATVATTVPNMARGSLNLVSLLFVSLQHAGGLDYVTSGWITGIVVFVIAFVALAMTEETFGKDLNYLEQ